MKLYDYQQVNSLWAAVPKTDNQIKGGLLGFEVGLGKTATAIAAVEKDKSERVLVVTRLVLKRQWAGEIEKWERAFGYRISIELSEPFDKMLRLRVYRDGVKIRTWIIAHYEQFTNKHKYCKKYLSQKWDAVILDEVHNIKNRTAQRTRNIKKLRTTMKIGLSGTLMPEYPEDLWSLLHWMDKREFRSYWTFVDLYCAVEERYGSHGVYKKVLGVKDDEGIRQLFAAKVASYLRILNYEDVGMQLPPSTQIDVCLEMDTGQRKLYKKIREESTLNLKEQIGGVLDLTQFEDENVIQLARARFSYEHQYCSGSSKFGKVTDAKLEWIRAYIEDGAPPTVFFCTYRHTVAAVEELLAELGAEGHFVGTYAKWAEGANLQHYHHMVMVDLPMSLKQFEQAKGRINRIGQEHPTFIYRLMYDNSVDENVKKLLDDKQTEISLMTDYIKERYNA
jgi:SNF2 family DNA or RNA helicase